MKKAFLILLCVTMTLNMYTQTEDDRIIISNQQETYTYKIEKGKVVVEEHTETSYEALKSASIPVARFYDNYTEIKRVKIKELKGITPKYSMYQSGEYFYSDAKICYFDLSFVRKGITAQVEFDIRYNDPIYFTSVYFPELEYVKEKVVRIVVPSWMKIELQERNFEGYSIEKSIDIDPKNGTHTYVYTGKDIAAVKKEANTPGRSYIYPHILVLTKSAEINGEKITFFEHLDDQYAWYRKIVGDVNNDKAVIASQAKNITEGCTSDIDKIKKTFAWVQDNIRYVAFEDGIAGFKPDDAQEVLRKRYGDCKGMANLVKSLLEAQGFDARLTWLGTNHIAYDYSTPSLIVDNHMICTLTYGGKTYYLDPTVKYMPLGEYPQTIQGRQVMIEDNESYILERIPVFTSQLNTDSLYCEYTIEDNILKGVATQIYKGESKQIILSLMDATPKDKLNDALEYFFKRGNVQNSVQDIKIEGADSQADMVKMDYNIQNKMGLQSFGNEYYIDPNPDKFLMNDNIDLKKRINDIVFPYKRHDVHSIIINIPQGYKVESLPQDLNIERNGYTFLLKYENLSGKIRYNSRIIMKDLYLSKKQFEQWNKDIGSLKKAYAEQIVLTKE